MSKCSTCRQSKLDTRWDRIRMFLLNHLFREDIQDIRSEFYTQGIGDGYKLGAERTRENMKEMIKLGYGIEL